MYLNILNIQLIIKEITDKCNKIYVQLTYDNEIKIEGIKMDPAC